VAIASDHFTGALYQQRRSAFSSAVDEHSMNLLAHIHFPRIPVEPSPRLVEVPPRLQVIPRPESPRIAIKVKGKIVFINLSDVVSVQAEGNYVLLVRESNSYLLRESISALEEMLQHHGFIRIHRSTLVNITFVEEIKPYSTGEYGLRMKGRQEYTVTRTYKKNLRQLAEFWIGSGSGTLFSD
jgi:DNA-binding LytR/AlgR family response regulator